ncbi:MAG: glycosyltransferase [Alphaproteobacteria bacterium]|nr:glycosyltransferase [Alphaproteobacteria bacterium]
MKTPEISVIIPAYNAQDTIVPCLDSIMRQDGAQDFEIIVINDGSTDNTGKIVQEYRYNRPNIKLANLLSNHGISVARNSAMQLATGHYITFVDADDMVGVSPDEIRKLVERPGAEHQRIIPMQVAGISYPNVGTFVPPFCTTYFTNLLKAARPDTNIVLGGKLAIDVRHNIMATFSYPDIYEFDLRPSDKSAAMRNAYMRENANFALYERRFLENNHLRFQPTIKLDEDILFCMQAVLHAETVITAPDVLYMYVRHDNSASTPKNYWAAYDLSAVQCFSVLLQDLAKYPEYSNIFCEWLQEFKLIGQLAHTKQNYFPSAICGQCVPDINKCPMCKRLSKFLNANIKTFVKTGHHR